MLANDVTDGFIFARLAVSFSRFQNGPKKSRTEQFACDIYFSQGFNLKVVSYNIGSASGRLKLPARGHIPIATFTV